RTDDIVDVMFTEGCGDDIQTFTVPANLKAVNANDFDNPDQYTIGKYSTSSNYRKCARFCLDDNKNVILWEAYPDKDCCPETPCCNWEVIETLEILSLCPGDTGTKILSVKNMCGDGTQPIHFTVEAIDDVLVSTKDFELVPDASKEIEVTITMPKDCEPGTTLEYKVKISSDCEEKTREITILVECEDCVVCCDFAIEYGRVPPPVCAGEIFQVGLYLENNCDDNDLTFKLKQHPDTKDKPGFGDIVDIKPREVTVDAGRTEMIKTLCEMPDDCTDGTKYTFKVLIEAYDEKGEKCGFKTIEYNVECKDCSKCCDVEAKVISELPKSVETGQWVEVTVAYENNCKNSVQIGVSPWIFPKMFIFGQKSFTIEPGESKNVVFSVEMPKKRDKEHKTQHCITYFTVGEECETKEFVISLDF
ncbi:MAG: hypothetical protein KAH30_02920, partial [Caldisericia bacterium]|nr:hypothetical protein [Caldisericia bacterium]